jgi:tetratricopeptide (TPR) repeat protein
MSNIKEFSYAAPGQRRILFYNTVISALVTGFILSDSVISLKYYFYYSEIMHVVLTAMLGGIFLGNLAGRVLFTGIRFTRALYIVTDLAFIFLGMIYFLRFFMLPDVREPLISLYMSWHFWIPSLAAIFFFIVGIKLHYFLKVACGNFIDERIPLGKFFTLALFGMAVGMGLPVFSLYPEIAAPWAKYYPWFSAASALLLPSLILLHLPYAPAPMFAQHFEEHEQEEESVLKRDDLFFTYLNFTFIFIYLYLGYQSIIKFYGDFLPVKLSFLLVVLGGLFLGSLGGRICKARFWHIYVEMIFPVFFLGFTMLLLQFSHSLPFYYGILLFLPLVLLFGLAAHNTINSVLDSFNHAKRHRIMDFSLFILPVPILIALSYVEFTYRWYFIVIYILALVNIFIPGIYLINREIKNIKKVSYFIFSLIFIPALVFSHIYFKIPLNNDYYVKRTENFNELKSTNFNALYIKTKADVSVNGSTVFRINDSIIRSSKRSLVPLYMHQPADTKPVLFIDGNQKFFRNSEIANFENLVCIDPIKSSMVDGQMLPFAGKQQYIADEIDVLPFFQQNEKEFFTIIDNLNLLDQRDNSFRFSEEYYRIAKRHLNPQGLYAQIFNLSYCNRHLLIKSLIAMKNVYSYHRAYLFSDMLVIICSDRSASLEFNYNQYQRLSVLLKEKKDLKNLFYSESHVLSHLLYDDIDDLLVFFNDDPGFFSSIYGYSLKSKEIPSEIIEDYQEHNRQIINSLSGTVYFKQALARDLIRNNSILTLLKATEFAEAQERYEDETKFLFNLKRYSDYSYELRRYLNTIMSFKEEYYYDAALQFEKEKNWDGAKILYRAILTINPDHFDANYRMGLLCLTLQELEESFKYLQHALKLKKEHPKVLYQMGVLLFASGRTTEALNYLTMALRQHEKSASVYHYLGLCHEKLGNMDEALYYYKKALIEDPNDLTIQASLDKINDKIEEEKSKWRIDIRKNQNEEEIDEEIPLPINKSAFDVRLND